MNTRNKNLYDRIIKRVNKAVNKALLESENNGTVKVVALQSDSLSTDSNLDLMSWGNEISIIFRLPDINNGYYFSNPNSNVCNFSERWYTIKDIDNALGDGNWEYIGTQKLRGYAHRGSIGGTNVHNIEIYTGEYPVSLIKSLFIDKKIAVRAVKGYSTVNVKDFMEGLIAEGFLDE